MPLTEQQERDILSLISGFGSPESENRAQNLLATSEEARLFHGQMQHLSQSFEPAEEHESEDLSLTPEQARVISQAVRRRAAGAAERPSQPRIIRLFVAAGIAAAILLAFPLISRFHRDLTAPAKLGSAERTESLESYLQGRIGRTETVSDGQVVQADSEVVRVTLNGGGQVFLLPDSMAQFGSQAIVLQRGHMALKGVSGIQARVANGTADLTGGQVLLSITDANISIWPLQKELDVSLPQNPVHLKAGQRLIANREGAVTITDNSQMPVPDHFQKLLDQESLR